MGISKLKTYLSPYTRRLKLFWIAEKYFYQKKRETVLIVDSSSFIFDLLLHFNHDLQAVENFLKDLKVICGEHYISLIFVREGINPSRKATELIRRIEQSVTTRNNFFESPHTVKQANIQICILHIRTAYHLIVKAGFQLIRAYSEADPFIIANSIKRKAYAIISMDTDFYLSSALNVIFPYQFITSILLACSKKKPLNQITFDGICCEECKRKINVSSTFIPYFSCLCGNDFTKSFNQKLLKKLGLCFNYNTVIPTVIDFIQSFTGDENDLHHHILNLLDNDEEKEQFENGIYQINRLARYIPEKPVIIPGIDLYNTEHSYSTTLGAWSIASKHSPLCYPNYLSPLKATRKIRKIIYSIFKPNSTITEYYDDGEKKQHTVHSKKLDNGDIYWWLKSIGFDDSIFDFVNLSMNNELPWWKTVFAIVMKYISTNCPNFKHYNFLLYEWYVICRDYPNLKRFSNIKIPGEDHRDPVHLFNYFHSVCFDFNEVLIDYVNISPDYLIPLTVPCIYQFVNEFIIQSNVDSKIDLLISEDNFFAKLCQLVGFNHETE
ncbi:hypothetical protein ENUP19_0085G0096 [Entamoeba nuttalli]|uniref:Uncharacterized protein n=2 Tax=Entamoeba nuttalli TaxID=412467 RepID=K2H690_ENTNP|nr:hypothetical protein ENU1_179120 [Entamoeba nuttalli P19]EKE38014.1 hypothetical protein ENU1_179120 [Entamoeba nuttalli P19]|eukprot:XP_008859649.1 hypothetical protein ENU1_179120 [Entamoeba nuttalli P19]